MIQDTFSRRTLLIGAAALAAASPLRALAQGAEPAIHVMKDPNCGCCSAWIDILENDGFAVTTEDSTGTLLARYKIEGHVPPADIRRLLAERPDAVGLAVPGMLYGSPGMGPEAEREAYDVFLIRRDGATEVFSSYGAA